MVAIIIVSVVCFLLLCIAASGVRIVDGGYISNKLDVDAIIKTDFRIKD